MIVHLEMNPEMWVADVATIGWDDTLNLALNKKQPQPGISKVVVSLNIYEQVACLVSGSRNTSSERKFTNVHRWSSNDELKGVHVWTTGDVVSGPNCHCNPLRPKVV